MNIIDLHVHSLVSDGSYTPHDLARHAREVGLSAFALTDHDNIVGNEEAAAAALAAEQAFPVFSQTSPEVRARFLDTLADELDLLGEDFFAIAHLETALPLPRLQGERARTSNQLRMFAGVLRRGDTFGVRIDTALPARQPLPRPDLRQYLTALGPVAVFGASNFPLAFSTAGGDTASALAAGCPVVVKAHPGHMATAELTAQAIVRAVEKAALPAGVFNMIFGTDIGADLVRHPAIQENGRHSR